MIKNNYSLSIIIPAYNEEQRILETLNEYNEQFKSKVGVEFIIVLNGCIDNTIGVVEEFKKSADLKITILNFPGKIGKGGAILEGIRVVETEYFCFVDADGAIPSSQVCKLFDEIHNYDGAIGSRYLIGSRILIRQTFMRIFASRVYNFLVQSHLGIYFKDTQCGGKIFKSTTKNLILENVSEKGWGFDVDLLSTVSKAGFAVKEVPIDWYHDDNSKIHLMSDSLKMYLSLFRVFLKFKKRNYVKNLYFQHHYEGQGTFFRSINMARQLATKENHYVVTCTNKDYSWKSNYKKDFINPYITIVILPRVSAGLSLFEIFYKTLFFFKFQFKKFEMIHFFALGNPFNSLNFFINRFFNFLTPTYVDWDDLWSNGLTSFEGPFLNSILSFLEENMMLYMNVKKYTVTSFFLKNKLLALGVNDSKIKIIVNGINQSSIDKVRSIDITGSAYLDSDYCVSMGNTYTKSFYNLIESFKLASNENGNLKLVIIGNFNKPGALGSYIEGIIKENRNLFKSKIVMTGDIPYESAMKIILQSKFVILPMENSPFDFARYPIRLNDYLISEKMIVSNATGMVEYILKKYKAGLICNVDSIVDFANAMMRAYEISKSNDDVKNDVNYNQVYHDLSWENIMSELKSFYV
jgi:dolichyl-phosphate beta-glucosyltransferase